MAASVAKRQEVTDGESIRCCTRVGSNRGSLTRLTTPSFVGIVVNTVQAELITRFKDVTPEGGVIEVVVWRVSEPMPPSEHGFKYRAAFAVAGVRVVGFDNERGKGDHCHIGGRERPYAFTTVEQLIEDFIAAVDAARSKT